LFFEKLPATISSIITKDSRSKLSKTEVHSTVVIRIYEAIGNLYMCCPSVMYTKV
jgi:hypothetical protein